MEYDEIFYIVDHFDQLNRDIMDTLDILPRVVHSYIQTLDRFEDMYEIAVIRNNELSMQLSAAYDKITQLESQIHGVRVFYDEQKKKREHAEYEKSIVDKLGDNLNKNMHQEMEQVLSMLTKKITSHDMSKVTPNNMPESETTGSFMTNLSYTRDEDDFVDISSSSRIDQQSNIEKLAIINKKRKKRRSSSAVRASELKTKYSRNLVETEALRVIHNSYAVCQESIFDKSTSKANCLSSYIDMRPHNFQQKAILKSEICSVCSKRLRFSAMGFKCQDCKIICHLICKDNTPLPCIPVGSTPSKVSDGMISDYAPLIPPMIPSLVVHCIKEVEKRGLTTESLYYIPGSDKDVKTLKEKFLRGKGVPNLSQIPNVHVISGCLKDFFRSLKDPLTTRMRWGDFSRAIEIEDVTERLQTLSQIVSELPQANRNTLAFLLLHLHKVAESPICKMPASNLANAFAPIIIGYSSPNPDNFYGETRICNKIMVQLFDLPKDFWESFLCEKDSKNTQPSPCFEKYDTIIFRPKRRIKFFETP